MILSVLHSSKAVFISAILLRVILLLWSQYQDTHSPIKYTDIDYYVFTDASRFVAEGRSPYDRETYRYTPLLAWLLWPTVKWFEFGKVLFASSDILAGWLLVRVLRGQYGVEKGRATMYAAVWLLNPMVAGISTRGSSEGLLGVLAVALVYFAMKRQVFCAGVVLGFSVHFKIYPFIYGPSILWYLESDQKHDTKSLVAKLVNRDRVIFILSSIITFSLFNLVMYIP
jgi:phosphatidylinositol glycan class M